MSPARFRAPTRVLTQGPFLSCNRPLRAGNTYANMFALDAAFAAVRLVFANAQPAPFRIAGACLAPSAQSADQLTPRDAAGQPIAWQPVTFGSSGADPQAGMAQPRRRDLPVPAALIPGPDRESVACLAMSDWIEVASLPRADGGLPLLMTRVYAAQDIHSANLGEENIAAWAHPSVNRGRAVWCHFKPGDHVTETRHFAGCWQGSHIAPAAIQYRSVTPGIAVLAGGDSLFAGYMTASHWQSWCFRACAALSTPARPVSYVNAALGGRKSASYIENLAVALDRLHPSIVLVPAFSPNDRATPEAIGLAWQRAQALARQAIAAGTLPVMVGPAPLHRMSPASAAARAEVAAQCRCLADIPSVDLEAVLGDGSSPPGLRAAFDCGDGIHPNDAGHAVMADALAHVLAPLITGVRLRRPTAMDETGPDETGPDETGPDETGLAAEAVD